MNDYYYLTIYDNFETTITSHHIINIYKPSHHGPGTYKTSTVQAFGSGQLREASSMESKARIIHVVAATLSKTQLARAKLRSWWDLQGEFVGFRAIW